MWRGVFIMTQISTYWRSFTKVGGNQIPLVPKS